MAKRELTRVAKAAKEIRGILKLWFPEVKFTVKSSNYSMGSSIHISWELGPTALVVEKLTAEYVDGWFDGMEDLYKYHRDGRKGGAKHVFCERRYNGLVERVEDELNELMPARGDDNRTVARVLLGKTNLLKGYRGLKRTDVTCGRPEEFFEVITG